MAIDKELYFMLVNRVQDIDDRLKAVEASARVPAPITAKREKIARFLTYVTRYYDADEQYYAAVIRKAEALLKEFEAWS